MAAPNILPFKVLRKSAGSLRVMRDAERTREVGLKRAIDRAGNLLNRLEARAKHFDELAELLTARRKHCAARAAAVEDRILELMSDEGLEKLTGNKITLTKRANAFSLIIDNLKLIPARFIRTKQTSEADKVAIKAALDRGEQIEVSTSRNQSHWFGARKLHVREHHPGKFRRTGPSSEIFRSADMNASSTAP